MDGSIALMELLLVFGAVVAFGFWELRSLRQDKKRRKDAGDEPNPPNKDDTS